MASKMKRKTYTKRGKRKRAFTPSGPPIWGDKSVNKALGKNLGNYAQKHASKSSTSVDYARKILGKLNTDSVPVKIGAALLEKTVEAYIKSDNDRVPMITETSSHGSSLTSSTVGRTHKTKFLCGKPPTKMVNLQAKLGGSREETKEDTKTETDVSVVAALQSHHGFNQKMVSWFNEYSYWQYGDVEALLSASSYNRSPNLTQRAYALTMNFRNTYSVYNKNKFLPVYVRIHMLRQEDLSRGAQDVMSACFSPSLPDTNSTDKLTVTYNQQLGGVTNRLVSTLPFRTDVAIDPYIGTLSSSKNFTTAFSRVKSFTKKLMPGETWEFDYIHETGSGLDFDRAVYAQATPASSVRFDSAAFFYPVFETWGPKVECIDSENRDQAFLGTAPGEVLFSLRKSHKFAADTTNEGNALDPDGFRRHNMAVKVFSDPSTDESATIIKRIFNVMHSNILKTGEATGAGKFIIPVTSDTSVKRGGTANESN